MFHNRKIIFYNQNSHIIDVFIFTGIFFKCIGRLKYSEWNGNVELLTTTVNIEQQPSVRCALSAVVGVINRYRPRTSGGTRAHSFHTGGEKPPAWKPPLPLPLPLELLLHFPGHNPWDRGLS